MKGIYPIGNGKVEYGEVDQPLPDKKNLVDKECVVKITHTGICGSDIHNFGLTPEQAKQHGKIASGHECVGYIEKGHGASEQPVLVYMNMGCGHCEWCARGEYQWCVNVKRYGWEIDGSFASHVVSRTDNILPLPKHQTPENAVLISCPGATAWNAILSGECTLNGEVSCVEIIGAGVVGLCAGIIARKLFGIDVKIVFHDLVEYRLDLARQVVANCDINLNQEHNVYKHYVNKKIIIETSGTDAGRKLAYDLMWRDSFLAIIGYGDETPNLNPSRLIPIQSTVKGIYSASFRQVADLLQENIDFTPIITHYYYTLDNFQDAMQVAISRQCGQVMLVLDDRWYLEQGKE